MGKEIVTFGPDGSEIMGQHQAGAQGLASLKILDTHVKIQGNPRKSGDPHKKKTCLDEETHPTRKYLSITFGIPEESYKGKTSSPRRKDRLSSTIKA